MKTITKLLQCGRNRIQNLCSFIQNEA